MAAGGHIAAALNGVSNRTGGIQSGPATGLGNEHAFQHDPGIVLAQLRTVGKGSVGSEKLVFLYEMFTAYLDAIP